MRRIWLDVDRRRGAIVLVVFRRVGLGIVELWKFELINLGEKHHWSCEFENIYLYNLVHLLQFTDISLEVRRIGRARGQFFGRLDIIRVAVALSNTCHRRDITVLVGGWTG